MIRKENETTRNTEDASNKTPNENKKLILYLILCFEKRNKIWQLFRYGRLLQQHSIN